jgi:hypothetical protein
MATAMIVSFIAAIGTRFQQWRRIGGQKPDSIRAI